MKTIARSIVLSGNGSRRFSARTRRNLRVPPRQPYTAFLVYGDVPAARHAMMQLKATLQSRTPARELQPMLWRCDQLDEPRWRDVALADAIRADVIVLALSENAPLDAHAEAWLTSLAARHGGANVCVMALFGEEFWTIGLQQTAAARRPDANAHAKTQERDGEFADFDRKRAAARAA
jgi:hypothetical protein